MISMKNRVKSLNASIEVKKVNDNIATAMHMDHET